MLQTCLEGISDTFFLSLETKARGLGSRSDPPEMLIIKREYSRLFLGSLASSRGNLTRHLGDVTGFPTEAYHRIVASK